MILEEKNGLVLELMFFLFPLDKYNEANMERFKKFLRFMRAEKDIYKVSNLSDKQPDSIWLFFRLIDKRGETGRINKNTLVLQVIKLNK
jgi:hypothetical protein